MISHPLPFCVRNSRAGQACIKLHTMVVLNHEVYGADCFCVMDRLDTQQDVRDVLARVVRIESAMATMHQLTEVAQIKLIATIQQQTAESQSQLLTAVQDQTAASQCQLMASVLSTTAASQSQLIAEMHHLFNQSLQQSQISMVSLVTALVAESQSKSSSPELGPIKICSFPDCSTPSPKDVSATQALRHMELCPYFYGLDSDRYLYIVQHMALFQQGPRVTEIDTCCWCNVAWEAKVTPDSRSRHRKICHQTTLRQLLNPVECVAATQRLISIWTNTSPASPSGLKRPRKEKEVVPPFSPPNIALDKDTMPPPWTYNNNADTTDAGQDLDFSLLGGASDNEDD